MYNGAIESLDDTIVGIKYVARAKKLNAVEIMFDYHSLLMSFESETTMRRWAEELRRIASECVCVLVLYVHVVMYTDAHIHIHVYTDAHIRMYVCTYMHTRTHAHTCTHTCTHTRTRTHMSACTHALTKYL